MRFLRRALGLVWWYSSEILLRLLGRRRPYAVLKIELSGDLVEAHTPLRLPFLRGHSRVDYLGLLATLRWAAEDEQVQAVYIKLDHLRVGWAKVQELRRSLKNIRSHGKALHIHLTQADIHEYVLASVASHITLTPAGGLDVAGLSSEVMFVAGALSKLGVQPELVQLGKYKSAGETFTRSSMSAPHREMVESLVSDLYDQAIEGVAEGRGIDKQAARAILDGGPFSGQQALDAKLVDALQYEDEAESQLQDSHGKDLLIEQSDYMARRAKAVRRLQLKQELPRIGLLHIVGAIKMGDSMPGADGVNATGADSLLRDLRDLRERDDIGAVVLRVVSPGGSGLASDLLWHEMQRIRKRKPLVVSFGDVAASGGYYIGVAGRPVVAENGTITGSIGVLAGKPILRGLYEKFGVTKEVVSQGKHAALHSDYLPLDEDDRRVLQQHAETFYWDFVDKVASGRSLSRESVDAAAQGRVWTGRQAKQIGLVDQIGGLERAIDEAKVLAGYTPQTLVALESYPRPRRLWRLPFAFALPQTRLTSLLPWWNDAKREKLWAVLPLRLRFF